MSEYLPSFIVEPVLRQARRFSRLSSHDEAPSNASGILPTVPESIRTWYPGRLWNTSPPPSLGEEEHADGALHQIARNIQQWTNQIPSPPLEPLDDRTQREASPTQVAEASASEAQTPRTPSASTSRPAQPLESRTTSETSLNPLRELPDRSREYDNATRGHRSSDPNWLASLRDANRPDVSVQNTGGNNSYEERVQGSAALPEDDGMGPLRKRINAIWNGPGTPSEKSRLVHGLMMENYRLSNIQTEAGSKSPSSQSTFLERPVSPVSILSGASQEVVFNLQPTDLQPTYAPNDPDQVDETTEPVKPTLGCQHYKRNVKMQCSHCGRWYTCRLCHDEVEDHILPRRETKHMLCMLCNTPQTVSQYCKMCHQAAGCYYCPICKLWSNDPRKSIYHCDDCGICRVGEGLGKDYFHCKTCAACMSIMAEAKHRCVEKSFESDCPICGEYLFTSSKPVDVMSCGHTIHESCFNKWCLSSYKCPICSKSITNMESQFRRLDRQIEEQPMPEEYRQTKAYIFCNDCLSRSTTKYHWLGLKCDRCESYNTTELRILGSTRESRPRQPQLGQEMSSGNLTLPADGTVVPQNPEDSSATVPATDASPASATRDQRPMTPTSHSPTATSDSAWLIPRSPPVRVRSVSPATSNGRGNYFGTEGPRPATSIPLPTSPTVMASNALAVAMNLIRRGSTPIVDDDNPDFWGGQSPPQQHSDDEDRDGEDSEDDDDDEDEESDEIMEDDDEDDEDDEPLALPGHR